MSTKQELGLGFGYVAFITESTVREAKDNIWGNHLWQAWEAHLLRRLFFAKRIFIGIVLPMVGVSSSVHISIFCVIYLK